MREKRDSEQEATLLKVIKDDEFKKACVRLVMVRNLSYFLLNWPEFWAVILSVNYIALNVLKATRKDIPDLIKSTYILHRE